MLVSSRILLTGAASCVNVDIVWCGRRDLHPHGTCGQRFVPPAPKAVASARFRHYRTAVETEDRSGELTPVARQLQTGVLDLKDYAPRS